jgi:hypothetical protein
MSVIVVLPEDEFLEPEHFSIESISPTAGEVEVTIACAGEPSNLDVLKRKVRNARFLMAPSGTSREELRELAMEQTPGDIVTLVDGAEFWAFAKRPPLTGD